MRKLQILTLLTLVVLGINAQFVEVTLEPQYTNQVYYNFEDQAQSSHVNTSWDIAVTTFGLQDAGVFINEAAAISGQGELQVFVAPVSDFNDPIDTSELELRLYNSEKDWVYGAFNETRNVMNPLDYGWGVYNPGTMAVEGKLVFVIMQRDGTPIKLFVEKLELTTYTIRWANLDGSEEQELIIDKNSHPNSALAYINLQNASTVEIEPQEWDLVFTRYNTPETLDGEFLNYNVSGVLSAPGVEVAQINDKDPETVDASDFEANVIDSINVIGFDWKEFDFMNLVWDIIPNRSYLVKLTENTGYKVVFIDFEGSMSGNIVFEQEAVTFTVGTFDSESIEFSLASGVWSSSDSQHNIFTSTAESLEAVSFLLFDQNGRLLSEFKSDIQVGTHTVSIPANLNAGVHFMSIQYKGDIITKKIIVE